LLGWENRIPGWTTVWARDTGLLAGSQLSTWVVTSALAVLVARELGPSGFGVFAGFLGLAQTLSLFTGLGISTWLLRELSVIWTGDGAEMSPGNYVGAGSLLSAAVSVTGTVAILLTAGTLVTSWLLGVDAELMLALTALVGYTSLLVCSTSLEAAFRARRRLGRVVVATLIEKGLLVLFVGLMLIADVGVLGIALGYLGAGIARVGVDWIGVFSSGLAPLRTPTWATMRRVVVSSVPFAIGSATPSAVVRLDAFLIGLFSTTVAGFYAVGDRLLGVLLIVPTTAAMTLYPLLAGEPNSIRITGRVSPVLGVIGAGLAAILILTAPWLVPLLFGDAYSEAVPGIQVILLAAPLIFAGSMLIAGMYSSGFENHVLVVMITSTVLGTGFVLGGQSLFGLIGAAGGYVCRQAVLLAALSTLSLILRSRPHQAPVERSIAAEVGAGRPL